MGRAPCCAKVGLHRGPWTAKEDMLLTKFIEAHGEGQWRALPKKAGLLRCGKSCRLRWMNYLRPDIKRGNITLDEEDLIVRLHKLLGNRWSLIAGRLPGRTDNEIKNFWNTHLSKKLMKKGVDPKTHQALSNKQDARESANLRKCRRKKRNMYYDRKNVSEGYAQPIHLPKANRYVAFPRSSSTPNLTNPGIGLISDLEIPSYAGDVLLSPSIDLNSPCSNTCQDSDDSSSEMLCTLSLVNDFVPQSVLPQNQVNNNSQDCSIPWPCIEEEEDWALSKVQSTENESVIPNSSPLHVAPASDDESKRIASYHQLMSTDSDVPSRTKSSYINKQENCSSITLQKMYEEYWELLQEDSNPNNTKIGNLTHNNDGEDTHVFSEGLSSVWAILQGDDDANMLDENNPGSQP